MRILLVLCLFCGVVACKQKKIVICAKGQVVIDQQCVFPTQTGSDAQDSQVGLDTIEPTSDRVSGEDQGSLPADQSSGTPDTTAADVAVKPGEIGERCAGDDACKSGLCLLAPGGYCSVSPCETTCPDKAICLTLGTVRACFKDCTSDKQCRTDEDYACKTLIKRAKPPLYAQVCRPFGEGKVGTACQADNDCEGQLACLSSLKGGYCAKVNCASNTDCAGGSKCVLVESIKACVKQCGADSDCRKNDGHKCVTGNDVKGAQVKTCLMPQGSQKIGETCDVNFDCLSKSCNIEASGKCNDGKTLCRTHQDCPLFNQVLGICKADKVVGTCSRSCSPDLADDCGSGALCANDNGSWRCIGACDRNNPSCPKTAAYRCLYGGENFQGDDGCVLTDSGIVGDACTTEMNCKAPQVCDTIFPAGFCTNVCDSGTIDCKFPAICVAHGNRAMCARRCRNTNECREGYECKAVGSSQTVCWPIAL